MKSHHTTFKRVRKEGEGVRVGDRDGTRKEKEVVKSWRGRRKMRMRRRAKVIFIQEIPLIFLSL